MAARIGTVPHYHSSGSPFHYGVQKQEESRSLSADGEKAATMARGGQPDKSESVRRAGAGLSGFDPARTGEKNPLSLTLLGVILLGRRAGGWAGPNALVYHLVYHGVRFLPLWSASTLFKQKENPLI